MESRPHRYRRKRSASTSDMASLSLYRSQNLDLSRVDTIKKEDSKVSPSVDELAARRELYEKRKFIFKGRLQRTKRQYFTTSWEELSPRVTTGLTREEILLLKLGTSEAS